MDALQSKLSKFGAGDTEPDWHYQNAIRNAFHGKKFESLNADGWELFSVVKGSGKAASRMNAATRKITNLILGAKVSELDAIRDWARGELWRVDI